MPDFFSLVAALLALILLVDISVLWISGRQVPELLSLLITTIVGAYFGRMPAAKAPHQPMPHPDDLTPRRKARASGPTPDSAA